MPVTAAVGSRVYAGWLNNTVGNEGVLFRRSLDNGTNFGPVIKVYSNRLTDSSNLEIAAVGSYVYLVWQQNNVTNGIDIFFAASPNNGTSFNPAVDISANVNQLTNSQFPQIAAVGNYVYVTWFGFPHSGYEILFKVSNSNGSNLGSVSAIAVSTTPSSAAQPKLAALGSYVYITWTDMKNATPQTFIRVSPDNGGTFSAAYTLDPNVATSNGDLDQEITASANNVYVTWTNDTSSNRDNTMFAASINRGTSFGPSQDVYRAPPFDTNLNPSVAASGQYVYLVWSNQTSSQPTRDVLYLRSANNGTSFGSVVNLSNVVGKLSEGQQIAASGSNVYVTWYEQDSLTNSNVYLISSSDNGLTFGTKINLSQTTGNTLQPNPSISTAGGTVYVAWEDSTQGNDDVLFKATIPGLPDVAITYVGLPRTVAYANVPSNPIMVNVTASNPGPIAASFVVSVKANSTFIAANQTVTNLAPGATVPLQFSWNTASFAKGNYTLTCYATQVTPSGETNLANNVKIWLGPFAVRLKGDVHPDCRVDIADLSLVGAQFGKTPTTPGFLPAADLNNDGTINISDMVLVASVFGSAC